MLSLLIWSRGICGTFSWAEAAEPGAEEARELGGFRGGKGGLSGGGGGGADGEGAAGEGASGLCAKNLIPLSHIYCDE